MQSNIFQLQKLLDVFYKKNNGGLSLTSMVLARPSAKSRLPESLRFLRPSDDVLKSLPVAMFPVDFVGGLIYNRC